MAEWNLDAAIHHLPSMTVCRKFIMFGLNRPFGNHISNAPAEASQQNVSRPIQAGLPPQKNAPSIRFQRYVGNRPTSDFISRGWFWHEFKNNLPKNEFKDLKRFIGGSLRPLGKRAGKGGTSDWLFKIDLADRKITKIPGAFGMLRGAVEVNLRKNDLTEENLPDLRRMKSLRLLDLRDNRISNFLTLIDKLPADAIVRLEGNPITADNIMVYDGYKKNLGGLIMPLFIFDKDRIHWQNNGRPVLEEGWHFEKVTAKERDIAKGGFGSVSMFENEHGAQLIGKIPLEGRTDELVTEWQGYRKVYKSKHGPHRNLVKAYGIGKILIDDIPTSTLLMDAVPGGQTGKDVFISLAQCWKENKIRAEEYWSAVQFITRRLLDVTEHLGKVGITHNDIKPENFLVDENTGEPILIDLGGWKEAGREKDACTRKFTPPEITVDNRSDTFTVGATLLAGAELIARNQCRTVWNPNDGLNEVTAVPLDWEDQLNRNIGMTVLKESAYAKFAKETLNRDINNRINSTKAKKLGFLTESILDDETSAEVLTRVIKWSKEKDHDQENQGNHSESFKATVALVALYSEKTLTEIAQRYKVPPSLVTEWKEQWLERPAGDQNENVPLPYLKELHAKATFLKPDP